MPEGGEKTLKKFDKMQRESRFFEKTCYNVSVKQSVYVRFNHLRGAMIMKTLYDGKTKTVMLDEETNVTHLFFKDSATGEIVEVLDLKMLSDGRLNWSLDMDGLIVEYYFTKQVAE